MNRARRTALAAILVATWIPTASAQEVQYVSPSGKKYYPQQDDKNLVGEADKKLAGDPKNVELLIALGDAYGTIWNHKASIAVYERAFKLAPGKPLLYQQRGHRYLSIRQFKKARVDLEQAVKLDEKLAGAWYYLGLLRYLDGDFAGAAAAYQKNVSLAEKFESAIGGVDWQYMSLRRAKQDKPAAALLERVTPELKVEGNTQIYFNRMLFYKGLKKQADLFAGNLEDIQLATLSYGVGNWYLYNGHAAEARPYFEKTVATTAWPALAFIASEVELRRLPAR
jgi:tetratricopeptide (TPR) repeat protein